MTTSLKFPALSMLALAACMLLPAAATAQTKKELAEKVVQMQHESIEGVGRALAGQVAQQVLQTAGQTMRNLPADRREAVGKEVQADIKKFYDDLEAQLRASALKLGPATLAPMLEDKLSDDELKQLVAWLDTSAAKKYQQMGAEMQSTLAGKLVEDTRVAVEPKLRALEQKLQRRFAAETPTNRPEPSASAPKPAAAPKKK